MSIVSLSLQVEAGAVPVLVKAMERHMESAAVLRKADLALWTIAVASNGGEAAAMAGAAFVLGFGGHGAAQRARGRAGGSSPRRDV